MPGIISLGLVSTLHMWDKQGIYLQILIGNQLHSTLNIASP